MSRVLVSFLGTGPRNRQVSERAYEEANYSFDDGTRVIKNSFIALALKEYFNIDRVILIGTNHSIWEEVYKEFHPHFDENDKYYWQLGEFCYKADNNTPLEDFPRRDYFERSIGTNIVLVKYGLNPEEIQYNQQAILGIEGLLNKGDELFVDITHSFRSIPLYLINSLMYIHYVSSKGIKIKNISYGMLEATPKDGPQIGLTPVVDVTYILDTVKWIIGAYAFKEFANAYSISEYVSKDGDKALGNRLKNFSDAMSLNYLPVLRSQTDIASLRHYNYQSLLAKMVIEPIVEEYSKSFLSAASDELYIFQFRMAEWHQKHQNYSSAYLCLCESVVSYVCHLLNTDASDKDCREDAKKRIHQPNTNTDAAVKSKCSELKKHFIRINEIRKRIAHSVPDEKGKRITSREAIDILKFETKEIKMIML